MFAIASCTQKLSMRGTELYYASSDEAHRSNLGFYPIFTLIYGEGEGLFNTATLRGSRRDLPPLTRRRSLPPARLGLSFFSPRSVASIPQRTCMLANGCGQITALPAFETLLTLRILARRARLTSLCPVENDDITIKLPSAYGN